MLKFVKSKKNKKATQRIFLFQLSIYPVYIFVLPKVSLPYKRVSVS